MLFVWSAEPRAPRDSPYMVELIASHFMEAGVPLTSFEYKEQPTIEELKFFPVEPCKTWSQEKLPVENRLLKVPIYVLTSHETFSAGEDFACHFKETGRATLIGETTGGGGDPNKLLDAGEFFVAVPVGLVHVPYGASWDGVGVVPDIQIEPGQDALAMAQELIQKNKPQPQ